MEKIFPISKEINKLQKDNNFIDDVLKEGAKKADAIASKKSKRNEEYLRFLVLY